MADTDATATADAECPANIILAIAVQLRVALAQASPADRQMAVIVGAELLSQIFTQVADIHPAFARALDERRLPLNEAAGGGS
jgi:hypothetical protein